MPLSFALTFFCFVFSSAAVVACIYSLLFERSKLFGIGGLIIALLTLAIQRLTLYFIIIGACRNKTD